MCSKIIRTTSHLLHIAFPESNLSIGKNYDGYNSNNTVPSIGTIARWVNVATSGSVICKLKRALYGITCVLRIF